MEGRSRGLFSQRLENARFSLEFHRLWLVARYENAGSVCPSLFVFAPSRSFRSEEKEERWSWVERSTRRKGDAVKRGQRARFRGIEGYGTKFVDRRTKRLTIMVSSLFLVDGEMLGVRLEV